MFSGTFTALITPFKNDRVDEAAFGRQIKAQVDAGVTGIVPVGTTGESPTLSHEEHRRVIEVAVALARGTGVKVIAGTGSNSTAEAIELTAHAKASGADAALLVNPYYNKPTQEGLIRHFTAIARQVDIPIVLYNIPGRTNVTMTVSTMKRLTSECKNIVAVKDAAGNLDMTSEAVGAGLTVLSGDDSLTLPMMAVGAKGVVSVASNIVPEMVVSLVKLAAAGDFSGARTIHQKLFALCRALFIETNPIPIKAAMQMVGRDSGELRLPLCEIAESNRAVVRAALQAVGLSPA
jgi:4-hydroxy-tetrahydrodipicolinate synthase